MLVLFRFKNFGPFKDEVTFDMRAVKAYKEHSYNLIVNDGENSLLKVVSIYGANASGKSNFIDAYNFFSRIVLNSFHNKSKENSASTISQYYFPFAFDDVSDQSDSEFEAIYQMGGFEYRYGFTYNAERIEYEWLYRTSLSSKRLSRILEREPNKIALGASVRQGCEKYIQNIDSDVLALSFFSSLKLRTHAFQDAIRCVTSILPLSLSCDRNVEFFLDRYFKNDFDETERPLLLSFLRAIDVGIKDILVEKGKNESLVYTYHDGKNGEKYRLPLKLESGGTRKAIAVYSLVRIAVTQGLGLMIDELNNELHPLLQKYIIDLFYEESIKGQLIYTTHDTSLLDRRFMRRDQVWFTSKNVLGESSLYSLAEFKLRNDKSFGADYLSGIFGGIPNLKDFSFKEE